MRPWNPPIISAERIYIRGCTGKRTYTKTEAKRAINRMHGPVRHGMGCYRCEHCGAWHIGHKPGTKR